MTTAEPPTFLKPGVHLDAYRIRRWRGGGAYGDVYESVKDGRHFALKVTKHRQSSDDPSKTYLRQLRELVCLVQLDHPNIAKVHGWTRTADGRGYLALDFVEGWTLAEWLQEMRPTFQDVLRVFVKLANALEHLHSRGVRHRDISLSNVMVRKSDGEPVIIDLGAGEHSGALELTDAPLPPGTTRYRSPEAARFFKEHRDEPSARYDFPLEDDSYALAVCLFDALTDPEPAKNADARKVPRINVNSLSMAPPPARRANPRVPEPLSARVARLLERDVEKRRPALASMREALEELGAQDSAEWQAEVFASAEEDMGSPETPGVARAGTRRRMLAGAAAVLAAVLAAVGVAMLMRQSPSPEGPPAQAAPESPSGPRAEAPVAPPSTHAPPASAVPSSPEVPVQKESPVVNAPKNQPPSPPVAKKPKKSAPVFSLEFLGKCAAATAFAAAQWGCPASQVLPTQERCPSAAVTAMKHRWLEDGGQFLIRVDVNQAVTPYCERNPAHSMCEVVVGDGEIESETREKYGDLPVGTRLYGRVWTGGKEVVARYTRARPPGEEEIPICVALGLPGGEGGALTQPGSKPGAAVLMSEEPARFIFGQWP
ncbi:serine/threonine protein kinase [Pyxidicoccus caerfyrddinensis]|uniref:serine/threonine protein kinase n=1 Tax=Pyxidicoccus caerfyrddinensis TaxID=2709663 RepID=UPI0013DB1C44|nr:serine/threonine-protein kinase [Pyxidicoccus caerfyrddinensis]